MTDKVFELVDLRELAENMATPAEANTFFETLAQRAQSGEPPKPDDRALLNWGIKTLMSATADRPGDAEQIILGHLVPACLQPDSNAGDEPLRKYELRELLAMWIDQYSDEDRLLLRKHILTTLEASIAKRESAEPALRTIRMIGFSTPSLERILTALARRSGDLGEEAIVCLAGISPGNRTCSEIVPKVLRRLRRPGALGKFGYVIQALRDSRFVPALARFLSQSEQPAEVSWAVGLLGSIADNAPQDKRLQRRIWAAIERGLVTETRNTILMTGNGVPFCNTDKAIPTLLAELENLGANHYTVYSQLRDCVRPEQLVGWSRVDKNHLKKLLAEQATLCTGNNTRSMTIEDHLRRRAWETALLAGIAEVSDWLTKVLEGTTSPFERRDALSFASFLRQEAWPRQVDELVSSEFNADEGSGDSFLDRKAAALVLYASGTKQAFEILLNTSITRKNSPLLSISNDIADLAAHIANEDREFVISHLFASCESKDMGNRRMYAVAALQRLAGTKAIRDHELGRLAAIAQDNSMPPYATAGLIWTLGSFSGALAIPGVRPFLLRMIDEPDTDLDVKFQSFQTLIRLDAWSEYMQRFVIALGLEEADGKLSPRSPGVYETWQGYILAQLSIRAPEIFLGSAKIVLVGARGDVVHAMLRTVQMTELDAGRAGVELGRSAIERARARLGVTYGETDVFPIMAALAADDFVGAAWEEKWNDWMPAVRASLADALQRVSLSREHGMRSRVFQILEKLLGDSFYQVRRAAARAYSRLGAADLSALSEQWIRSGQTVLRIRAAEIAQWEAADDNYSLDNSTLRRLRADPEPSVRKAAVRSWQELRNRVWRTAYLERIRSGDRLDGNKWVSECFCFGRALATVGDDETLRAVNELCRQDNIPPNVRTWLRTVADDLTQNWARVTREWPEPGVPWSGELEVIHAEAAIGTKGLKAPLTLWRNRQNGPLDRMSWGGGFQGESLFDLFSLMEQTDPSPLSIPGRNTAEIWFTGSGSDGYVTFIGNGPYPEPVAPTSRQPD